MTAFKLVGETDMPEEAEAIATRTAPNTAERHTQLLLLSLRALSQRAVVAASTLFTALAVLSAWYLWFLTLPNPSQMQLVGLAMYALFLCAVETLRRKG